MKTAKLDLNRCLQSLSTTPGPLPEWAQEIWGARIYGCNICQNVCPVNRRRKVNIPKLPKENEHIPLAPLIEAITPFSQFSLKKLFPGTALEAGWVPGETIARNILIAAGNSGSPLLEAPLKQLLSVKDPHLPEMLRKTAEESLKRLACKR